MKPKRYIQFFVKSAVSDELVEQLGSDGVYLVDGRLSIYTIRREAVKQANSLNRNLNKGIRAYQIRHGTFSKYCNLTNIIEMSRFKFGDAIEALRNGKAIRRDGWNGKGMFVTKQVPSEVSFEILPKMTSLNPVAKTLIAKCDSNSIKYQNQMLLVQRDGRADSWVPSSSDIFAEDWEIID